MNSLNFSPKVGGPVRSRELEMNETYSMRAVSGGSGQLSMIEGCGLPPEAQPNAPIATAVHNASPAAARETRRVLFEKHTFDSFRMLTATLEDEPQRLFPRGAMAATPDFITLEDRESEHPLEVFGILNGFSTGDVSRMGAWREAEAVWTAVLGDTFDSPSPVWSPRLW